MLDPRLPYVMLANLAMTWRVNQESSAIARSGKVQAKSSTDGLARLYITTHPSWTEGVLGLYFVGIHARISGLDRPPDYQPAQVRLNYSKNNLQLSGRNLKLPDVI